MDEKVRQQDTSQSDAAQTKAPQNGPKNTVQRRPKHESLAIPVAIIFGFALIAAAIYFSGTPSAEVPPVTGETNTQADTQANTTDISFMPIDENDHIRGNPNAPIVILEYSDFDCPYCKQFHETMKQIMDKYGTSGKVAWAYRNFPIKQLHPDAPHLAVAAECVAKLGGNDAFWKFADQVFEKRDTNAQTDLTKLPTFAKNAGVNVSAFSSCLSNGDTQDLVDADISDGMNAGAQGTPYSLVLVAGQKFVINGAQPYSVVSSALDNLISQMGTSTDATAP